MKHWPGVYNFQAFFFSARAADLSDSSLLLYNNLCVSGDAGAEWSGQGQSLVKRVCVQRLSATKDGSHRLNACTNNVVVRIL